jgi:hypothetical protein
LTISVPTGALGGIEERLHEAPAGTHAVHLHRASLGRPSTVACTASPYSSCARSCDETCGCSECREGHSTARLTIATSLEAPRRCACGTWDTPEMVVRRWTLAAWVYGVGSLTLRCSAQSAGQTPCALCMTSTASRTRCQLTSERCAPRGPHLSVATQHV